MSKEQKKVFTVEVYTEDEYEYGHPIYATLSKEAAEQKVKELNKKEAWGVKLTEDMLDIEESDENYEIIKAGYPHKFYMVGALALIDFSNDKNCD